MTYETIRLHDRPPLLETLFENEHVKIDRVTAQGQTTPKGEFPEEPSYEFIQVLQGQLVLEYGGDGDSRGKKVTLKAGDHAIKTPKERTRADYTAEDEETVYVKVSYQGKRGRYPAFTGAIGADEAHRGKAKSS